MNNRGLPLKLRGNPIIVVLKKRKMKSLNSLSIHAIEKNAMERVAGGTPGVKAGSFGSWSWSAGDYTDDYENGRYTRDFSGSVSYDGKALNGVLDPRELSPDVPEEFIGGAYYFE